MGLLDEPELGEWAERAYSHIDAIAADTNVVLSPFARELVAVWAVSMVYEPTNAEPAYPEAAATQATERVEAFEGLLALVQPALDDMQQYRLPEIASGARLIRSVEVFHWIADHGNDLFDLSCPCLIDPPTEEVGEVVLE